MIEGSYRASFREVRRLAYLRFACDIMAIEKSSEINLASEKFLNKTRTLNWKLRTYTRNTGKVERISVAKNHFIIAKALGLMKIEGEFVKSTSISAFFASLLKNDENPFYLSLEEKLSFFEELFEYKGQDLAPLLILFDDEDWIDLGEGINRMKIEPRPHVDQIVKSGFDWFVDLGLLSATSARKGKFGITRVGKSLREVLESSNGSHKSSTLLEVYAEDLLGHIDILDRADDESIMSSFHKARERTRKFATSEISRDLLSALPIVLFTRLQLLAKYRILLSVDELITHMRELLPKSGISFKWDPIYKGGYIRT